MNILIVEDEPPIAENIEELSRSLLKSKVDRIDVCHTVEDAREFLNKRSIDLCLLDLNLMGSNGYEILKTAVAGSFHTIVVSAHVEQAYEAFEYGILDFVPKPVSRDRLQMAFEKYSGAVAQQPATTRFISVRKHNTSYLYSVEDVSYFEADSYLVTMHLKDGKSEFIEKPLNRLMQILPSKFIRAHRSCIIDVNDIASYKHKGGGVYEVVLKKGIALPLSRKAYKLLNSYASK